MSECTEPTTIEIWRTRARQKLDAERHAELDWLIQEMLEISRGALLSRPDQVLTPQITQTLDTHLNALCDDVPLAYLLGSQPFWSMDLTVTRDTLVPRADTEILVHAALARIAELSAPTIADLGTGSGAIAIALGVERPDAHIHAVDCSEAALTVARHNAANHAATNIEFFEGDWTSALPDGRYEAVVSNPPYVETNDGALPSSLKHEPAIALAGGVEGLSEIHRLVPEAVERLKPEGWLMIEHGNMQAAGVSGILLAAGLVDVETVPDIAGRDRVTLGRRPNSREAEYSDGQN
ncbi:MAG: peptide chain release factor N(5)-glutamine methyltransferase [Pseudomonadota bacterium]